MPSSNYTNLHYFPAHECPQMREQDVVHLDEICRSSHRAKLLIVRSYGLVGYLRVSTARVAQELQCSYTTATLWDRYWILTVRDASGCLLLFWDWNAPVAPYL